jgi:hypothetical protein
MYMGLLLLACLRCTGAGAGVLSTLVPKAVVCVAEHATCLCVRVHVYGQM